MKRCIISILLVLLMLTGCTTEEPEPIEMGGQTYLPFSSGSLSFYYPEYMSPVEDEESLLRIYDEEGSVTVSMLDHAAPDYVPDGEALLEALSANAVNELARQTGMEAEFFSVTQQNVRNMQYGERNGIELSYTVNAQISGYEFESSCSVVHVVIFGSDGVYIITAKSDTGDASQVFAGILSTVACR